MAIVTEIELKHGKVEIWLDGTLFLRVPERDFKKLPLEVDEDLEPSEYVDRLSALQLPECYEAALTILDGAAKTGDGMRRALGHRGYVSPAAAATVDRLCEIGLIDDRRYAERVAQSEMKKNAGAYAVRRKLRAQRLSEEEIESVMFGFDGEQQKNACLATAKLLARKYGELPIREGRAKLSQALARRGFGWDVISEAVESVLGDGEDWDI